MNSNNRFLLAYFMCHFGISYLVLEAMEYQPLELIPTPQLSVSYQPDTFIILVDNIGMHYPVSTTVAAHASQLARLEPESTFYLAISTDQMKRLIDYLELLHTNKPALIQVMYEHLALSEIINILFHDAHIAHQIGATELVEVLTEAIAYKMLHTDPYLSASNHFIISDDFSLTKIIEEKYLTILKKKALFQAALPLENHVHIKNAHLSLDGRYIATLSGHKQINLWDTNTQLPLKVAFLSPLPHIRIEKVFISAHNSYLIASEKVGTIRVWNLHTGAFLHAFKGYLPHFSAISPDERYLATLTSQDPHQKNSTTLWDLKTGKLIGKVEGDAPTFSPNGSYLLTTKSDSKNVLYLWRIPSCELVHTFTHSTEDYYSHPPLFSPDGTFFITISCKRVLGQKNHEILVWNLYNEQPLYTLVTQPEATASVNFSSENNLLVTASYDKVVRVWDLATGRLLKALRCERPISYVQFFLNNSYILIRDAEFIYIYNFEDDCTLQVISKPSHKRIFSYSSDIQASAQSGRFISIEDTRLVILFQPELEAVRRSLNNHLPLVNRRHREDTLTAESFNTVECSSPQRKKRKVENSDAQEPAPSAQRETPPSPSSFFA